MCQCDRIVFKRTLTLTTKELVEGVSRGSRINAAAMLDALSALPEKARRDTENYLVGLLSDDPDYWDWRNGFLVNNLDMTYLRKDT
jgi:hypothetical protein